MVAVAVSMGLQDSTKMIAETEMNKDFIELMAISFVLMQYVLKELIYSSSFLMGLSKM